MEILLRLEVLFLLFIYPPVMGMLLRNKKITVKRVLITTITSVSIVFGTLYLFSMSQTPPSSAVQFADWASAIGITVFMWLFLFLMTKPFHKS